MARSRNNHNRQTNDTIIGISISGFKSLLKKSFFEIRSLTVLAGANSSGKSSAMQPLLLLKQTLEATYDPGPLRLDGPNIRFTSTDQVLSMISPEKSRRSFSVGIDLADTSLELTFDDKTTQGFRLAQAVYDKNITIRPRMSQSALAKALEDTFPMLKNAILKINVIRERCFLDVKGSGNNLRININLSTPFESHIRSIIHVPGLRGNPARTYNTTSHGTEFPGTFEHYVASIIRNWQSTNNERLEKLGCALKALGLTWKVRAKQVDDTQFAIQVARLRHEPEDGTDDLVNIADVGFGVSQVLPVLVALLTAETGQLVYLEQPELHLHPRAQTALAEILADAARRGVRVVVETHSQLLLTAIQTLVAEGKLAPEHVKLHWFSRRDDGVTEVASADLDEAGAFGEDWPEDFAEVTLETESRYLDAAEQRLLMKP